MAKPSRKHRGRTRTRSSRLLAAAAIGSLGIVGAGVGVGVGESATGASSSKHFEGTFSGLEANTFNDARCSALGGTYFSDTYNYTFDFPTEDWAFRAQACATISGNPSRYSAVANFTITRPGGTLTGSYVTTNLLPVPHDHVGYLNITGGTGAYENASGTCGATNWVTSGNSFSGTVTCDVSPK